jgi:16S rRNA (guanine527-N7)-methyltransferase
MTLQPEAIPGTDNVSRETLGRMKAYADLLRRWNPKINLVSKNTLADLWTRHIADSAQLFDLRPEKSRRWVDLGSGGGFPGAVVAILAKDAAPEMSVTLVESDQRKAAFLRAVSRETGVKFDVIAKRIEELEPLSADVLSARALAPLSALLGYARVHMDKAGVALFPKGANAEQELRTALETWRFDCQTYKSQTDEDAVVLKIGDIERV